MNDTAMLLNDAAALRAAHAAGSWRPTPAETTLAADLARAHWTAPLLRAALRRNELGHRAGGLASLLLTAAAVLEDPGADVQPEAAGAWEQLRQLVDALAAED